MVQAVLGHLELAYLLHRIVDDLVLSIKFVLIKVLVQAFLDTRVALGIAYCLQLLFNLLHHVFIASWFDYWRVYVKILNALNGNRACISKRYT